MNWPQEAPRRGPRHGTNGTIVEPALILINLNNVDLYGTNNKGLFNWQYFWLVFFITIKKLPQMTGWNVGFVQIW